MSESVAAQTGRRSREPLNVAAAVLAALVLLVVGLAALLAVALPYGEWDAMTFGVWSREIATAWPHLRFPDVGAVYYHRPLFYVAQGWLWAAFGFHQWLGRLLSLAFAITLVAAAAWIAARTVRVHRAFAAALAALVVILMEPFDRYASAGLSDVPVAAMIALTAVALVTRRLGRAQPAVIAVSALLAVLAKPSSLPALVGLIAAVLLGPRADLRRRAVGAASIAGGTAVALIYDVVQARYVHSGFYDFLTAGTGGFYDQLADEQRRRTLLDVGWLGGYLRPLLVYAIVYALCRLRLAHRLAVPAALTVAVVWSWLGPHLAGAHGFRVGIFGTGTTTEQLSLLVLVASLLFALRAPEASIAGRLDLARGLVWALPPTVLWARDAVYDVRLLAPAWPAFALLIAWSLLPSFAGAASIRRAAVVAIPVVSVAILGAYAIYQLNGLGQPGWKQLRSAGWSGLHDPAQMRDLALGGDFGSEMNAVAAQVQPQDRIVSSDPRLRFFYHSQVDAMQPSRCSQLRGHRVFVLVESDELRRILGERDTAAFWEKCPGLTKVDERPDSWALFTRPRPGAR